MCYAWEILVDVELLEIFLSIINAMLSLDSSNQGWLYNHAMRKYFYVFGLVFCLIKQLSEWITWVEWKEWFMLSGSQGHDMACVSHLWMATQEQRDLRCQMLRSFKCNHLALWALPGSYRLNLAKWTVGGRGNDRFGARPFWSKGRLLKGPVLVKIKSCGESAQPLQSVKSKYLAMSLAKDNLSIKTWKQSRISSSKFQS